MTRVCTLAVLACVVALSACTPATLPRVAVAPDDSPEPFERPAAYKAAPTYAAALATWRTPEDVSAWTGAQFVYDPTRAALLSESGRARTVAPAIHSPADFFVTPSGICVDLARFTVETLQAIDPALRPAYLMIEFEPTQLRGETLRLHWLASFRRDGGIYFTGDSKRPALVAGPYASVEAFLDDYASYRQRTIVAFRETESYERRRRVPAPRVEREPRS